MRRFGLATQWDGRRNRMSRVTTPLPSRDALMGQLAVAAGMHAGALLTVAALGETAGKMCEPTRIILLQAASRVVTRNSHRGERGDIWKKTIFLAASALSLSVEMLRE